MLRTHRRRTAQRRRRTTTTTRMLVLAIAGATTVTLSSHQGPPPTGSPTSTGAAVRPVSINRTVPRVSPPPPRPVFSSEPTPAEIMRARVFAEPLVPLGSPTAEQNAALARAVNAYIDGGRPWEIEPFQAFLRDHPMSSWRASLLANLGSAYRASGYFTRALSAWDEAWKLASSETSVHGRAVADISAANALDLLATIGHLPGLDRWLARTIERPLRGPAQSKADRARESRAIVAEHPERTIASGPKALEILLQWRAGETRTPIRDVPPSIPGVLKNYKQTAAGTSLSEVRALAAKVGLSMKAVRRERGASLVTPAIVHLGFDHFSLVLEEMDGRFRVRDPALGGEIWMAREALDEEMTGAALIMSDGSADGWRELSDSEADAVVGHSCPPGLPDPDERPCPEPQPGMPVYTLHPTQASVLIDDVPLGYTPPRGPSVALQLRYNHREENQPQIPTFGNIGVRWTMNWLAYLEEVPFTWFNSGGALAFAQPEHIAVHVPQGGVERYVYPYADGTYARHYRSAAVLALVSTNPLVYERRHADGSKEIYGLSDGGVVGQRRVFLTSIVDPHGQTLTFTWDAQLRLVAVTDALGQVTTLQYAGADPLTVTSVTDPFGRVARVTYDSDGHLETITDVINLTSRFTYQDPDFIAAMQTPYGVTSFRAPYLAGQYNRAVEAIDPLGARERLEFHYENAPVPETVPASDVPPGFEAQNSELNTITSLHWRKGRDTANVQEAIVWRWLIRSMDWFWDPGWTVAVPHSVQRIGEARTWFRYVGSTTRPARVARKLPDGSVFDKNSTYNYQDNVTSSRDPVGRLLTFTYAGNGIDLLEVRNTTGGRNDVLGTFSNYTPGHLPRTITDAAGQTAQVTYGGAGQVLTETNAKQETTTYLYDSNGYLQTVTGSMAGASVAIAYDGYGRVRSVTPAGDAVVSTDYDALNRPTRTTYPDGTYEETAYDRLDAGSQRDRAGRLTRFTYNARRQLVATRDPAGRVVQQQWCGCGALDALIDANGNTTRWERDEAGRVRREIRADGVTVTDYTYDALGRLATMTDPKQQVTTYTFYLDGLVASVAYTNAQIATPGLTLTYDPAYPRVTSMVDGTGTTSYTYRPVGQLGAGQIATVDGPFANDLIGYTYDQLGRAVTRTVDGVPVTLTFDSLGRVTREINALGTFEYTFAGVSSRVATVTYPNNQTSTYSYYPAAQEHRLQQILHRYPNGATLSQFDYTYDPVGNIATWRQQSDTSAVQWEYNYDAADQLVRALKRATDPQGTILQRLAYGYDPAGNRLFEQRDDAVTAWTYDRLNRLVSQQAGGLLRVAGSVNEPATVRVQGHVAAVDGANGFVGGIQAAAGTTRFTVTATDASGNAASESYDIDQAGPSKTFTFDANGNMTSDGTRTFEWDAANELRSVSAGSVSVAFTYNGQGQRISVSRAASGGPPDQKTYVWADNQLVEERNASGSTAEKKLFFEGVQAQSAAFAVRDHLGSAAQLLSGGGTMLSQYAYDPLGRPTVLSGNAADSQYSGHPYESSIGLSLAPSRAYDPELGRWLSPDPLDGAAFSEGPNLYAYVSNNAINYIDPDGQSGFKAVKWLLKGGQRLGWVPTFNLPLKAAKAFRRAGKDVCYIGKNPKNAYQRAKKLEDAIADGRQVKHHPKDFHKTGGNQPHFQTEGLKGHTFYKVAGMMAATTYLGDNLLGNLVDVFNPLSTPKDLMDIYDMLFGATPESPCGCDS